MDADDEIDAADGGIGGLWLGVGAGERGCAVSAEFTDDVGVKHSLPMRTAAEQFAVAGNESGVVCFSEVSWCFLVGGKGGQCTMPVGEWEAYLKLCGAPTISMRAVDAEDERQWDSQTIRQGEATPAAEDLQRIYGALETALGEVVQALDYLAREPFAVTTLTKAQDRLRLCIGTVSNLKKGGAS